MKVGSARCSEHVCLSSGLRSITCTKLPILFLLSLSLSDHPHVSSLKCKTEASLGLQSGARAKKEIERSKSSYFKK